MIKEEIRSLIRGELPKLDKTNKFHARFIDAAIEKVLGEMYTDEFKKSPHALQRYTKGFGYTTAIPIAYEASTGIYYVSYPTGISIVPFPDKASGVRRISTMIQGGLTFFPMDAREVDLVRSGGNVSTVNTKIGYIVLPTRIEFYNMTTAVLNDGCRMDLIIPFSNYADTDVVLIPEEVDKGGQTFTDRVLKILGVIQPIDLKDDNADAKQQTI